MSVSRVCLVAFLCVVLGIDACKNPATTKVSDTSPNVQIQPAMQQDEPPKVQFDIKDASPARGPYDVHLYDCTYQAGGKTARFRLQLKQKGSVAGEIPMAAAEGKFLAVADSDNSVLLQDLRKALEGKQMPRTFSRIAELSFDAVVLAERQSRSASGEYSDNPPGDWILVKLFLPKGGDDGELFLNLNPILGKAEFSIKDSDYGDYLLAQFAKVL
jgi:hypothetical protein